MCNNVPFTKEERSVNDIIICLGNFTQGMCVNVPSGVFWKVNPSAQFFLKCLKTHTIFKGTKK